MCKAAHDFLAKLMPINQRKILRQTVIGSLEYFSDNATFRRSQDMQCFRA